MLWGCRSAELPVFWVSVALSAELQLAEVVSAVLQDADAAHTFRC